MAHPFEVTDEFEVDRDPRGGVGGDRHRSRRRRLVHGRERDRAAGGRRDPHAVPRLRGGGHGDGVGAADTLREPHAGRRGRRPPRVRIPRRGAGQGQHRRPLGPQRVPRRQLGEGVRGPVRGRPDVLRQAAHLPHVLPRPQGDAGERVRWSAWSRIATRRGRRSTAGSGSRGPRSSATGSSSRPRGCPQLEGEVDWLSRDFLGVRTDDGIYRFMHISVFGGPVGVGHHIFVDGLDQTGDRASLGVLAHEAVLVVSDRRRRMDDGDPSRREMAPPSRSTGWARDRRSSW